MMHSSLNHTLGNTRRAASMRCILAPAPWFGIEVTWNSAARSQTSASWSTRGSRANDRSRNQPAGRHH